jgi:hypothetical protein
VKELVEEMIKRYVEAEKSIVLLVISARMDYATYNGPGRLQAMEIPGLQNRTLEVITCLNATNDPERVSKLIDQRLSELNIRWCCLQNLSHEELQKVNSDKSTTLNEFKDREEVEFFKDEQWKNIPESLRGISFFAPNSEICSVTPSDERSRE